MDRKIDSLGSRLYDMVALRKESVDRKWARGSRVTYVEVALRKESVDRKSFRLT